MIASVCRAGTSVLKRQRYHRSASMGSVIKRIALLTLFTATLCSQSPFRVTLLGTGSPAPRMDRFGPSILVEAGDDAFLFDAGRGALQRLNQAGKDYKKVRAVFLTHLHSDHT